MAKAALNDLKMRRFMRWLSMATRGEAELPACRAYWSKHPIKRFKPNPWRYRVSERTKKRSLARVMRMLDSEIAKGLPCQK